MKRCKDCKFNRHGFCDEICEEDDDRYPHNNNILTGLNINIDDDSGLSIRARVSDNFGCMLFESKH